jgi:hypothetical protein
LALTTFLLLAAGVALWMNLRKPNRPVTTAPQEALAERAAIETSALLGGRGHVRLVSEKADSPSALQAEHVSHLLQAQVAQARAFKEALRQKGPFTLAEDWFLLRGPMTMDPAWTAGAFSNIVRDLPEGAAVVSFASLPPLSDEEVAVIRAKKIALVVVGQAPAELSRLLQDKTVRLAVVYRKSIPPNPADKKESPQEWLARVAEVLPATARPTP